MMQAGAEDEFLKFAIESRSHLARIARHTRGEYSIEDVGHEAWLLARELQDKGQSVEFEREADRTLLLKYLYQKLVRYTDTRVRFAERFEARSAGEDEGSDRNLLLNTLASDSGLEPLQVLLAHESTSDPLPNPPSHESPASALVVLLRAYDNKMAKLADYLLISVSHCYRCYARARRLAVFQRPLRPPMLASEEEIMPRPWRRFRISGRRRDIAEANEFQNELI